MFGGLILKNRELDAGNMLGSGGTCGQSLRELGGKQDRGGIFQKQNVRFNRKRRG